MIKIPEQLQKEEFRFVLLREKSKKPFEAEWTTKNNYKFNNPKLLAHIGKNGNYGVMGCYGNLVILDIDKKDIYVELEKIIPNTFTVTTGGGGRHYYFISNNTKKIIFDKDNIHYGELQAEGAQCVGAHSIHPKTGKEYEILINKPIAILTEEVLNKIKQKYKDSEKIVVQAPKWNNNDRSNIANSLSIMSVVDASGLKKSSGGELFGKHPIHGSETGMNFWVSPSKELWHCFRHDSGGDPLSWIAIKEGICNCEDFGATGKKLRGKDFIDTLKIAQEQYGLKVPTRQERLSEQQKDSPVNDKNIDKVFGITKKAEIIYEDQLE